MSEAISTEEKTEKVAVITESKDPKVIEGEIGDKIIEGDEIFVIEEVPEEKDTKSDKETKTDLEDASEKKDAKPKTELSDEKPVITESMQFRLLEKTISKMKKELEQANLSPEAIRQRVPLGDLQKDIERQRTFLTDIDKELNPDEWSKQNRIVAALDTDIATKERNNELQKRYKSKDNTDFLKNERKLLAKKGFDFSDEQFDGVAAAADPYLVEGMYTSEAIQKGLTDVFSAEIVSKMYQTSAELKLRDDLKTTASKVTKSTRVTRSGTSAKLVPLVTKLLTITEPDELEDALDKLTPEEYVIARKSLDKIKK